MIIDSRNAEKFLSITKQLDKVNEYIANVEALIEAGAVLKLSSEPATPTKLCPCVKELPNFVARPDTMKGYMDSLEKWRNSLLKDLESIRVADDMNNRKQDTP